jgi:sodium transport system permease protein
MLGYLLLLLMFSGGMYPVMDMTVGERERKTLEAFLASPALRREIVFGKTFGMVYSLKRGTVSAQTPNAAELRQMMGTIPLDPRTVTLIALTVIPLAIFAASVLFAIALKARSFKEAQTYLMPLMMLVIFPAFLGGLPGLTITPALCLIPIFNASQIIRGALLRDVSMVNFGVTLAANLA